MARNSAALAKLTGEHGVQLRQFPDEMLKELAVLSDQVVREQASKDKQGEDILKIPLLFSLKSPNCSDIFNASRAEFCVVSRKSATNWASTPLGFCRAASVAPIIWSAVVL